jgi:hypothetical protein
MDAKTNSAYRDSRNPGAAWRCAECQAWWGVQLGARPSTSFLLNLPEEITTILPWEEYRGWKGLSSDAHTCPSCGQRAGTLAYSIELAAVS